MATTTTAPTTIKKPNAAANAHPVRFIVVFLATVIVTMRYFPVPVSMPVALGAALVADEPSFKRLALAIVAGGIAASIYLWQRT
jgi:hypothetical protein